MVRPANPESGNIVIYILGAIVLMGLLIVMLKGSSTPGSNIDAEQLAIRASEVQQYGAELERAVSLITQNGFSESDIRFAHPNASSTYGTITDVPARQVFSRDGGGATFRSPPAGLQTAVTPWLFTSADRVHLMGVQVAFELTAILPNVTKSFCLQLNKQLGVPNPSGNPIMDGDNFDISTPFAGTFAPNSNGPIIGYANTQLKEGCIGMTTAGGGGAAGSYHYFRVLLIR